MAKTTGLGGVLKVSDASSVLQTISNDCTNYSLSTPRGTEQVTGIDKFAEERILLLGDSSLTLNGVFNTAANMSHAVFNTVCSTSVSRSVEIDPIGTTTGNPKLTLTQILTDYQITRAATGELTWQVPGTGFDGNAPTWTVN
jgi:hypothetical protein